MAAIRLRDNFANFIKSLEKGKVGEFRFIDLIHHYGYDIVNIPTGKFKDYDNQYKDKNGIKTAEIKTCFKKSFSLPIEFESHGESSGIETTKANLFFILAEKEDAFYYADTTELRYWLVNNLDKISIRKNMENDGETWILLVSKEDWLANFYYIDLKDVLKLPRE